MGNFVYILKCNDNTLYTGATKNVSERVKVHNDGKGSKYTRARLPVKVVYAQRCENWSKALKRENEIKKLHRIKKISLIKSSANEINIILQKYKQ